VAQQEPAGELKAVLQILLRPAINCSPPAGTRQPHHRSRQVSGARDTRRRISANTIDQVGGSRRARNSPRIEPEAKLGQHRKLEPDHMHRRAAGVSKSVAAGASMV